MADKSYPELSIVVPLYNEEENVGLLYNGILVSMLNSGKTVEFIFIDDGSKDNTFKIAEEIAANDPRLRVVKFRRNYGQTAAMAAGIDVARGKIVVTMDGDLQNDPADIPNIVQKLEEGYDIVVGWRFDRKDKLISRKLPSRIANWLIGKVTGIPIKDNGCSLKAFRAEVIKQVPLYSEMHRFIPAMASLAGPRIAEIKVRHHARKFGQSKYGLSRVYKVLLDLLTIKTIASFAARPMLWFGILAMPIALISCVMLIGGAIGMGSGVRLLLPLAGAGLFFGSLSVFLVFGGALAELVVRTGQSSVIKFPLLIVTEVNVVRTGKPQKSARRE